MKIRNDLTGRRFGRLVAQYPTPPKPGEENTRWVCHCDCGATCSVPSNRLSCGTTQSCGCLRRILRSVCQTISATRHGEAAHNKMTGEYSAWTSMNRRCKCKKGHTYRAYKARGIRVCRRWKKYENFLADMGRKPSPQHTVDRIDNNRGYTPQNCRWATRAEQTRNRRNCGRCTVNGETLTRTEWRERFGVSRAQFLWQERRLGSVRKAVNYYLRLKATSGQ